MPTAAAKRKASPTDIIETSVYRMILSQNNFTSSTAVGLYQSLFGFALVMLANWIVRDDADCRPAAYT